MAIENTVSSDFNQHLSSFKSVFDCRLPGVIQRLHYQDDVEEGIKFFKRILNHMFTGHGQKISDLIHFWL